MHDGAVKLWEEKDHSGNKLMNELMTKVFVEQPLALPEFANKYYIVCRTACLNLAI